MNIKFTASMLILIVLAIGGIGGYLANEYYPTQPPADHSLIISEMAVKVDISTSEVVSLTPRCTRSVVQQVKALDMKDIGERALWVSNKIPLTEWVWELEGHVLAYMKIWGPKSNLHYVEFSRASMQKITFDFMENHVVFESSLANPPYPGFWYAFVEIQE